MPVIEAPHALTGSWRPDDSFATWAAIENGGVGSLAKYARPGAPVSFIQALDMLRHRVDGVTLCFLDRSLNCWSSFFDDCLHGFSFIWSQHGFAEPFLIPE